MSMPRPNSAVLLLNNLFIVLNIAARLFGLFGMLDGRRLALRVLPNSAARGNVGAIADPDMRDQRRIRTDENSGPDITTILVETIIVSKDRTRPNVRLSSDPCIGDTAQVNCY
jgi:hypothetical protein